ncbi:MAG: hypothetical protein L3J95_05080, partial [Thermoplasmata archaeon]|nr:hypothetical protein [Thermoplasmata archaeon]
KKDFVVEDVTSYRAGRVIAVSTYGGFFNVSPGLYDPQTIILDDAHDAESHIAKMWSVLVDRSERKELYMQLVSLFEPRLPKPLVASLYRDSRPARVPQPWMIPFGALNPNLASLRAILDAAAPGPDDPELYFPWTTVRDGLASCCVYISWDGVLIRPYIPPTLTHPPFARALQRVYMSATLGSGGELERSSGVPQIKRIPTPKTYASHGVGRRLFIFPDFFRTSADYQTWLESCLVRERSPRTLVLTPTLRGSNIFKERVETAFPGRLTILSAAQVESSLDPFTQDEHAVLVLSGRYDGIDLPHETCRQIILLGLPSGTNLQESFLERTLGLDVLLRERTKTRIAQGTGRCTRSDTDYAVVVMVGRRLLDFCVRIENLLSFHPELRAELQFALDQRPRSFDDLDSMVNAFLTQDEKWAQAEQDIQSLRSEEPPPDSPTTSQLADSVKDEVDYSYAMWAGNHGKGVLHARAVVDRLSGVPLASYRAFWSYNVAGAATLAAQGVGEFADVSHEFLRRASEASRFVTWFAYAAEAAGEWDIQSPVSDQLLGLSVEGVTSFIHEIGTVGPTFVKYMDETERLLHSHAAPEFDVGLARLGGLLGFEGSKPEGTGSPDAVWQLGTKLAVVFEGKAGEAPHESVSIRDCTQTAGHLDWAKSQPRIKEIDSTIAILVTPRSRIARQAVTHADRIRFWSPTDALALFTVARRTLESIRSAMVESRDVDQRSIVAKFLTESKIDPESIRRAFLSRDTSSLARE